MAASTSRRAYSARRHMTPPPLTAAMTQLSLLLARKLSVYLAPGVKIRAQPGEATGAASI